MKVAIAIPVLNEEAQLADSVHKLTKFLSTVQLEYEIIIADNGSTDRTFEIAQALSEELPHQVRAFRIAEKGRGRALKRVWSQSNADILTYMDVDLSTDLKSFPPLVEAISSGRYDIAVGSRLLPDSTVIRGIKREVISRCYNRLLQITFRTQFSDAQCGFKAISKRAATALLPSIEDNKWFFDTELLVLAEHRGYRICDVPVHWVDDPGTSVKLVRTILADLYGMARLKRNILLGIFPIPQTEIVIAPARQ